MQIKKFQIGLAIALLLVASAGQAATVIFENGTTKANGIQNLVIDGTAYNVAFTPTETVAAQVYGAFPGTFDFTNAADAAAAMDAVNIELNKAGAQTVGAKGSGQTPFFRIGYQSETVLNEFQAVIFWESAKGDNPVDPWFRNADPDIDSYALGIRVWADFIVATECTGNEDCDDGNFCNGQESCVEEICVDGTPPCEEGEFCNEETDTCDECEVDADCDDGEFCNGEESCDEGSCTEGTPPCEENEICDEETDTCGPGECKGDFNDDGNVDGEDLSVFASEYGREDCP